MGIIFAPADPRTPNLEQSETVQSAIDFCVANNRLLAAICAAPGILGHKNLLYGLDATCYPGVGGGVLQRQHKGKQLTCVLCQNFITGMSAGCATGLLRK